MSNPVVEQLQKLVGLEASQGSPSPFGRWLNGKLLEVEEGFICVSLEIRPEMTNPAGIMHGGAMAGFMDEIMGMVAFTMNKDSFFAALNINVDFLRPGKTGETIIGKASVVRAGKTIMHITCEILDSQNRLLAKASSNQSKTSF